MTYEQRLMISNLLLKQQHINEAFRTIIYDYLFTDFDDEDMEMALSVANECSSRIWEAAR